MDTCNQILERLSQHLDGQLPDTTPAQLRQEAAHLPGCAPMLDAMLWVHQSLAAAPMLDSTRDFAVSVTKALTWQRRRDKLILGGTLGLTALIALIPMLLLLGAGLIAVFEPGFLSGGIAWLVSAFSAFASLLMAAVNIFQHLPQWAVVPVGTLMALSVLLLSLIIVLQKAPEQLLGASSLSHQGR
jgi:hypothetical protein